jgi:hypothetical protein
MTFTFKKIMPLLLISVLIVSVSAAATHIQGVKAENAAIIFNPNYTISGVDPSQEPAYTDSVANMIAYYFNTYGQNYGYVSTCEDQYATKQQYMNDLSSLSSSYYNLVVYSKGHEWNWTMINGNTGNFELIPNDYGTNGAVQDSNNVYPYTTTADRFVFLWHCGTAMSYPSTDGSSGWEGMAYDFTHDNSMHTSGLTNPDTGSDVFMGFIWYSPEYYNSTGYNSNNYGDFVTYFYQGLLQYGDTVSEALNYASGLTLGNSNLALTPFYTGMSESYPGMGTYTSQFRVYGDSNLHIPA